MKNGQKQRGLADRLARLFPSSDGEELELAERSLNRHNSVARAIQELSHNDGDPETDKSELNKFVNSLERAKSQLLKVKYHGSRALQANYDPSILELSADSAINLRGALAEHLNSLTDWARAAENATPVQAHSTAEIFGDGESWGEGRLGARKTVAHLLALGSGEVFEELAKKEPTVITDPISGSHSGKFLEMIEIVFDHFDIHASAQTWAKETVRIRRIDRNAEA